MKIAIDIDIISANTIAHKVLKNLSAYALELLIEEAQKELKKRIEFEGE